MRSARGSHLAVAAIPASPFYIPTQRLEILVWGLDLSGLGPIASITVRGQKNDGPGCVTGAVAEIHCCTTARETGDA